MAIQKHALRLESFSDWLRRCLIEAGELLRPKIEKRIFEQGAAAVRPLIQSLKGRALLDVHAGRGWAPIHATVLLGELRASEAIPDLLTALADEDYLAEHEARWSHVSTELEHVQHPGR